jgi:hypothetical protein
MAIVKAIGPGLRRKPPGRPASLGSENCKIVATICLTSSRRIRSSDPINLCRRASRVETATRRTRACNSVSKIMVGTRNRYHYCRATSDGRKSENCCRICGKLGPSISQGFRNLFINKGLDLPEIGPPLANCVAPAQVRLYWCPKSLSF